MKLKLLFLSGLPMALCAALHAQLVITTNTAPPVVGAYDQYYLPGAVDEAAGAMTLSGANNTTSAANDSLTYVAGDQTSKGQTFTTGSNPLGYTLGSVTIRNILWTNFLANGTYMSIPSGSSFDFRFGTISGANITALLTTNATYSGSALSAAGTGGSGIYFTFNLSGAGLGTLSPNTTYFFEIAASANPPYLELNNTRTNATYSYAGGSAFYGDTTANLDQSGVVNFPVYGGEFSFDAALAAVGAPTVAATVNPASGLIGQAFTVTATVTPGAGTVTNVSVNLGAIGGSAAAKLVLAGGNVYTNTFLVPAGASFGSATLIVTATDTTPLAGNYGVSYTVLPNALVWDGGSPVNNNWSSGTNWQGNLAPALAGNNIVFAGTTRPAPNMDNNYSVSALVFSNTAGSFTIGSSTAGTLTVGSGGLVNNSASAQTLNVPVVLGAAQTLSLVGNLTLNSNVTGGLALTKTGPGTLTLAGPGASVLGDLLVTSNLLQVAGGNVTVYATSGNSRIDAGSSMEVDAGASLLVTNGGNAWFPLSDTAGTTNTLTLAGGMVLIQDNWGMEAPRQGNAIINLNSGSLTVNDSAGIGLILGDQSTAETGTLNLNGGTLVANLITANNGSSAFYFNGGTLQPIGNNANFFPASGVLTTYVRNGGAVVNTAGLNVTIAQTLNHSPVAGDNAVDGGLTKTGNGILTLQAGAYYTGPTRVLGGTLSLNPGYGVASTGDLLVSNATLALDASSGTTMPAANVILNSRAVLNLTNYAYVSTISGTGSLLVQTNTVLNLNYGSLGGNPAVAAITVAGPVSVTGTNNVINLSGTGFTVGQFPLLQYASGSLAAISDFQLGTLPVGVNAVLVNNTTSQSVDLNITLIGQTLTWYGTNALWNIGAAYNWNTAAAQYLEYGSAPDVSGDLVTFDDTLYNDGVNPQFTNVNLTTTLHPSQITENSSLPYSFTGAGSLAGAGSLLMNGSGSLTLGTANSYTGGTFVNAGTLLVTNDSALGAGTLTLGGGTIQFNGNTASVRPVSLTAASTVDVVAGATAQLSGAIAGTADLAFTDLGTLVLSPADTNSFGNLRVSGGQLNLTTGTVNVTDSQGSSTRVENNATLVVSGGTLNITGGASLNGWFPIGVTGGSTGTVVVAGGTINVTDHWGTEVGNESGSGVLTINSGAFINNDAGGIGLLLADGSSPQGTINLNGGALIVNSLGAGAGAGGEFFLNGGTLQPLFSNAGFWNNSAKVAAYVRNGGAVVNPAGFSVAIGQPLLHSPVAGDNALDGGLTLIGSGTLSLNAVNTYTGPTVINGGILSGTATLAGALTNHATLAPGTLTVNGNITLAAGSTNTFAVNGSTPANNSIIAGAGVTYGGTLNLVTAGTFTVGQQFPLFSGAGAANSSQFARLAGSPGSGLAFSFTNGVLSVVAAGPGAPAPLTASFSGGVLSLSWPAGSGWHLQMQTNSLATGLSTNWVDVTDTTVSSTNITPTASTPAMLFRLKYP